MSRKEPTTDQPHVPVLSVYVSSARCSPTPTVTVSLATVIVRSVRTERILYLKRIRAYFNVRYFGVRFVR